MVMVLVLMPVPVSMTVISSSGVVSTAVILRRGTRPAAGSGLRGAAPLTDAIVDALEQARHVALGLSAAPRGGVAVEGEGAGLAMVAALIEAELGLDGGAVDAVGVQALAGLLGELHVLLPALLRDGEGHLDVHRGDELRVRQLPDVYMVAADDAGKVLDVLLDLRELEVVGGCLE